LAKTTGNKDKDRKNEQRTRVKEKIFLTLGDNNPINGSSAEPTIGTKTILMMIE
jgi:hypothetical protein